MESNVIVTKLQELHELFTNFLKSPYGGGNSGSYAA
jgi:hypothetical protein